MQFLNVRMDDSITHDTEYDEWYIQLTSPYHMFQRFVNLTPYVLSLNSLLVCGVSDVSDERNIEDGYRESQNKFNIW